VEICPVAGQLLSKLTVEIMFMKIQLKQICSTHWMRTFALVALAFLPAVSLHAVGFRLPNQDPEAIARGNAFVATADDPAAIFYNPAGITQLEGQQASVGAYVVSANSDFSSSGGSAHTDTTPQLVPQLYYVNSFTNVPLSVGLGIYVPYGLSLDWGNNAPFATAGYKGSLLYASVNPVIAWKVTKTFSIAAGATLNYSQASLNSALPSPPLPPGYQSEFKGDGWAPGYNLGVLWQPASMWSFGLNYHSKTEIKYSGHFSQNSPYASSSTSSSATIPFPEYIVGGISFRPTPNWNFEFDLDWTKWDDVKSATFNTTPFGNQTLTFNYQNSFIYEFGATRQLGDGYWTSVGYMYSENSSPSQNFVPLVPDMNLHIGGIGFGHHGQRWDWALAYHFAYGTRTVSDDTEFPAADGHYRTFNEAINLSATFKF
jgi:long-chain fatty acid transport protein